MEDDSEKTTPSGRRRYPKTGGFRKTMTPTDNILIHGMLKQVRLNRIDAAASDTPTGGAAKSDDGMSGVGSASVISHECSSADPRETLLKHFKKVFAEKSPPKHVRPREEADDDHVSEASAPQGQHISDDRSGSDEEEDEGKDVEVNDTSKGEGGDKYDALGVYQGGVGGHTFLDKKPQARKRSAIEASADGKKQKTKPKHTHTHIYMYRHIYTH
eukprot:8126970-Pyramimonas_sp.AAC.1